MPQSQFSIVRIGIEALRVLFVLGVATWYYALPKFIERQEIGSKLGVVALLGSEGSGFHVCSLEHRARHLRRGPGSEDRAAHRGRGRGRIAPRLA
jgi:hypothetical protein